MNKKGYINSEVILLIVAIVVILGIFLVSVTLLCNAKEKAQCNVLRLGGSEVMVMDTFWIEKECFVELENGKMVNADNYRGYAE